MEYKHLYNEGQFSSPEHSIMYCLQVWILDVYTRYFEIQIFIRKQFNPEPVNLPITRPVN